MTLKKKVFSGGKTMSKEKFNNVLDFYYTNTTGLKEKKRQGWIYWNISGDRLESVPEHIWGAEILALAMWSEFDIDVDICKVVTMLSLHEEEEVIIPDLTPFDNVSNSQKLELGNKAVEKICKKMRKKQFFIGIITEFNERKTPEAKFAYWCDKMECDLQAKLYSDTGRFSFNGISDNIINDARIQKLIENGAKTLAEIFHLYDEPKFEDSPEFLGLIKFLNEYAIEKIK